MAAISIGGYDTRGLATLINEFSDESVAITKRLSTGRRASPAENTAKDSIADKLERSSLLIDSFLDNMAMAQSMVDNAYTGAKLIRTGVNTATTLAGRALSSGEAERKLLDLQFQDNLAAMDIIAKNTNFNGQKLIEGSLSGGSNIQTDITGISDATKSFSTASYDFAKSGAVQINGVKIQTIANDVIVQFIADVAAIAVAGAKGAGAPPAITDPYAEGVTNAHAKADTLKSTYLLSKTEAFSSSINQMIDELMKKIDDEAAKGGNDAFGGKGGGGSASAECADVETFIDALAPAAPAAVGNTHSLSSASDELVITLGTSLVDPGATIELFSLDSIGGTVDKVTFSIADGASSSPGAIIIDGKTIKTAKERAEAFAAAISAEALLKDNVTVIVEEIDADSAKLILKRTAQEAVGSLSFLVSVKGGDTAVATEKLADQVKSVQVGEEEPFVLNANTPSPAKTLLVINSEDLGEEIVINQNIDDLASKVADKFKNASADLDFKLSSTREKLSMLSVSVDPAAPTVVNFKSKRQGSAGNFAIIDMDTKTGQAATYDNVALVGSLGIGNVFVSGGVGPRSLIKSVSGDFATTGFVPVPNTHLTEGSKIKFGGREFTLKTQIKDPDYEIQLRDGDPTQTLENITVFLNASKDPSLSNFMFETRSVASVAHTITNELKITTKSYSAEYNSVTMKIQDPTTLNPDTELTLKDGFTEGLSLSKINDSKEFLGQIKGFKASFEGPNKVELKLSVGDIMYEGVIDETNPAADREITMQSNKETGGFFTFTLAAGRGFDVDSAEKATEFARAMDGSFEQLTFYQQREIVSFEPESGSSIDNMLAYLTLPSYPDNLNIISATAESTKLTGKPSITVKTSDGKVYKNRPGELTTSTDIGQKIELIEENDSNSKMTLVFGTEVDFSNDEDTKLFENDLIVAFKADSSPMKFQSGEEGDDFATVKIDDYTINSLFDGEKLTIETKDGAERAIKVLQAASIKISAYNANIGSLMQTIKSKASALQQNALSTKLAHDAMRSVDLTREIAYGTENNNRLMTAVDQFGKQNIKSTNLLMELRRAMA